MASTLAHRPKLTRGHSCIACYQRKVKCDGKRPCSTCIKASRSAECRSARGVLSGRQATANEQALILRLKRCEQILESHGLSPDGHAQEDGDTPLSEPHDQETDEGGHVILQGGHPRFVENLIWSRLGSEFADDLSFQDESGDIDSIANDGPSSPDSLFFAKPTAPQALAHVMPDVPQMLRLWQTFLNNFNPLVKLLHSPTTQQTIHAAITETKLDPSTEALIFSISVCAVTTMTEQECMNMTGEPRTALLTQYSEATQQALVNAQFLKSTDIVILQSLTLYLLARWQSINEQVFWLLTGVASRLAQAMGIHREQNLARLSPFDAEIRRRLWWQIIILDSRSAQISGATKDSVFNQSGITRRPLNVSDSDLSPSMRKLPIEHDGPTEMLFCTVRFEIGECMRQLRGVWSKATPSSTVEQNEQTIATFETRLEDLLSRCDESIPLHLMSMFLGRCAICQMRFSVLQSKQSSRKLHEMPPEDRAILFDLSLQILEYHSRTYFTPCLRPFLWHVGNTFPFAALIHVLICLLHRSAGARVNQAWASVNQAYNNNPELIAFSDKSALYTALGNLMVKAWDSCPPIDMEVNAVTILREKRLHKTPQTATTSPAAVTTHPGSHEQGSVAMWPGDASAMNMGDMSVSPLWMPPNIDWSTWQDLEMWK